MMPVAFWLMLIVVLLLGFILFLGFYNAGDEEDKP